MQTYHGEERRQRKIRFRRDVIHTLEISNELAFLCENGVIVEANAASRARLGNGGPEDLLGQPFLRFVDDRQWGDVDHLLHVRGVELDRIAVVLHGLNGQRLDTALLVHPARELGRGFSVVMARDVSAETKLKVDAQARDEEFRLIVERSMHMVARCRGHEIVYLNHSGHEMLKIAPGTEVNGLAWSDLLSDEYRAIFIDAIDAFLDEPGIHPIRLKRADGETIDVQAMFIRMPSDGRVTEFILEAREITAHNRAVAALRRMNETLEQTVEARTMELAHAKKFVEGLIEAIPNPVWWKTLDDVLVGYNSAFRGFHGLMGPDWIGRRLPEVMPECRPESDEGPAGEQGYEAVVKSGHGPRHVLVNRTVWTDEEQKPAGEVGVMVDISKLKAMEEELRRLATTDAMTGCFNRRRFDEDLGRLFYHSRRYKRPLTVMMLDIDRFKGINDTFGHPTGDAAIIALAKACLTAVRQQDFVARLGGDEFAILLPETNLPGAMIVAARLHQAIRDIRLDADGRVVRFTGSIGVTAMGAEDAAPTDVLARADAALYQAKQTRDTVSAIEPSPVIPE